MIMPSPFPTAQGFSMFISASCHRPRHARGWAVRGLLLVLIIAAAAVSLGIYGWLYLPMEVEKTPVSVSVNLGDSPRVVAQKWVDAGVQVSPFWLYEWFRWSGRARSIRAGNYELQQAISPRDLLDMMRKGNEAQAYVRLIDGWTFKRWRAVLAQSVDLQNTTGQWSDAQIMAALGAPNVAPEGRFFPDTYAFAKGGNDLDVLRRSYQAMQQQLDQVWQQQQLRQATGQSGCPLASPDDLLTLASIIEKETGTAQDRSMVAAVFCNRLRIGMPLQTDPTVIYGLGDAFDGNLRRTHLRTDNVYNTYTRRGLPPTPIAMPSKAALEAAIAPANSSVLYFVARGDGSSVFSHSLSDHNQAVNQYQRNQNQRQKRSTQP